jgi:D-alanine-D-alanine ligase-like ATP-grasp enzyme
MFIAVDVDGTMHKTAFTEFNKQYTRHPDTHIVFENYHIPHIQKMIDAAIRLHELVPQIGIAHWDFTLSQEGEPVLIEANLRCGGIWLVQLSHGKGPFGERTAEIIRWIVKMQKIPYSKRKQYRFGYMEPQK